MDSFKFQSSEALLKYLREQLDDIEGVVIPVQEGVAFTNLEGRTIQQRNVGAVIKLCSGEWIAVHRNDAAMLINDGVLQRMKIKCSLETLKKS